MSIILLIVIGGVVGWLASLVMRTDGQQGLFLNVVVGVVGAFVAGYFLSPLLGIATITAGALSLPAMFVSFLGALIVLAVVNLIRRGSVR